MFSSFWSDFVELTVDDCAWPVVDTDSFSCSVCALEDFDSLRSLQISKYYYGTSMVEP